MMMAFAAVPGTAAAAPQQDDDDNEPQAGTVVVAVMEAHELSPLFLRYSMRRALPKSLDI